MAQARYLYFILLSIYHIAILLNTSVLLLLNTKVNSMNQTRCWIAGLCSMATSTPYRLIVDTKSPQKLPRSLYSPNETFQLSNYTNSRHGLSGVLHSAAAHSSGGLRVSRVRRVRPVHRSRVDLPCRRIRGVPLPPELERGSGRFQCSYPTRSAQQWVDQDMG